MIELEFVTNLRGCVRFDPHGIEDSLAELVGGGITLRLTRAHGVRITVWTELARDLARALNAARTRRADRLWGLDR